MTNADCIADIEQPEVLPSNKHKLTVSYASRHPDYARIPALTLKGQWLEAAGFATGTEVEARVMNGCIVLTAKEPEPELLASLRGGGEAVGEETEAGKRVYWGGEGRWSDPTWIVNLAEKMNSLS
jgi:toxic protein SymE